MTLFFDITHNNFEVEYIALQTVFSKAKEENNTILCNYELILLRFMHTLTSAAIIKLGKDKNIWFNYSVLSILWSVSYLNTPLTYCDDTNEKCSTLRTFLKN